MVKGGQMMMGMRRRSRKRKKKRRRIRRTDSLVWNQYVDFR